MSTRNPVKSTKRAELLQDLSYLARKFGMQTVFLQQGITQTVGLNATDTRCLDLITSHPNGMLTAGRLSELTGLTTGAITHIVDRLEKRGFVERVRDADDRRRVFVRARSESLAPLLPKYKAIGKAYNAFVEHYSNAELTLIRDYMAKMSQMTERLMTDLTASRGDD